MLIAMAKSLPIPDMAFKDTTATLLQTHLQLTILIARWRSLSSHQRSCMGSITPRNYMLTLLTRGRTSWRELILLLALVNLKFSLLWHMDLESRAQRAPCVAIPGCLRALGLHSMNARLAHIVSGVCAMNSFKE